MRQQSSQIVSQTVSLASLQSLILLVSHSFPMQCPEFVTKEKQRNTHIYIRMYIHIYIYVCVCFSQMFVKAICLDQMEDGIYVRLARTAVVIRAGAEPVGSNSGLRFGPGPVLTRFTWKTFGVDVKAIAKCGKIQLPKC